MKQRLSLIWVGLTKTKAVAYFMSGQFIFWGIIYSIGSWMEPVPGHFVDAWNDLPLYNNWWVKFSFYGLWRNNRWFVSNVSSRTFTGGVSLVKATLLKQQQKRATCFATLRQNELKIHVQTCLVTNHVKLQ